MTDTDPTYGDLIHQQLELLDPTQLERYAATMDVIAAIATQAATDARDPRSGQLLRFPVGIVAGITEEVAP